MKKDVILKIAKDLMDYADIILISEMSIMANYYFSAL